MSTGHRAPAPGKGGAPFVMPRRPCAACGRVLPVPQLDSPVWIGGVDPNVPPVFLVICTPCSERAHSGPSGNAAVNAAIERRNPRLIAAIRAAMREGG